MAHQEPLVDETVNEFADCLPIGDIIDASDGKDSVMRLRRAETVLRQRTGRFLLVLDQIFDSLNVAAVIRTTEALGVQHVWIVRRSETKHRDASKLVHKGARTWLTLRYFDSPEDCIAALKADKREIWSTSLGPDAMMLSKDKIRQLPAKLAVVVGCEASGVCHEFLAASDRHVFLPMFGFTESFNLSVATALLLQKLFDICPEARGDLPAEEKAALRSSWYVKLAPDKESRRREFADLAKAGTVEPLDDIRLPDDKRIARAPPRLRQEFRAQNDRKVKGRAAYKTKPGDDIDTDLDTLAVPPS